MQKTASETQALDQLRESITNSLDSASVDDVLSVLTGAFVALTVELAKRSGHDTNQAININGLTERDITLHPPKK